jgi:hypothetical protein
VSFSCVDYVDHLGIHDYLHGATLPNYMDESQIAQQQSIDVSDSSSSYES